MFKRLARQPYVCARCIRKQQIEARRHFLTSAATAPAPELTPASHGDSDGSSDDAVLRKLFDSQPFWNEFSKRSSHAVAGRRSGLLQNKYLTSPQGFQLFTNNALKKCHRIVDKVLSASSTEEYKALVTDLDKLSDQLCRVIDLVDFIRNVHPDPEIQNAAASAHAHMFEYMNILNTTTGLNDQLQKASKIPEVVSSWSEEEAVTAKILLKDFAQSAITGPEEKRETFIKLSNDVVVYGNKLLEQMAPKTMSIKFSSSKMKGMDPVAVRKLTKFGITTLPAYGSYARMALRSVEDPDIRREIYMATNTASDQSIKLVEKLVKTRAELSLLSGHQSFAHMTLGDKMAKTPEAVFQFLSALAESNRPLITSDLRDLLEIKESDAHAGNFPSEINAWDREYYSTRLRSQLYGQTYRPNNDLSQYFSVGTVMQGLSRLFNRLYGIRLVPAETLPGETWNEDVRRLDVIDENDGHVAVMYCDLFQRPNKSPNPAHFTLRCSREISSEEVLQARADSELASSGASLSEYSLALNDGMALNYSSPPTGPDSIPKLKQLPTIGFICDFPRRNSSSTTPALLNFRNVATLFHEMGHCLHSILGRTKLQNVAGTRCATDFAELPSVLMEHFAASPAVLSLYARHWETDAPLNVDLVAKELEMAKRLTASQETEMQILLSVLDQAYHGPEVALSMSQSDGGWWDSSEVYTRIWNDKRFASVNEPKGTRWQGFFGHLFSYGGVYYSYLFDRAIAGRVWKDVFDGTKAGGSFLSKSGGQPRALDRAQGQLYRDEVLKWGGSRDPWRCVAGVLGKEYAWMSEGGEEAMKEVGKWGAGEAGEAGVFM